MFHVTKSGYSSSRLPKAYGRREEDPEGAEESEAAEVAPDEIDVLSVKALREDAVERVDGVEELEREAEPKLELEPELELELEPESSRRRDIPGKRMEVEVVLSRFLLLAAVTCSISSSASAVESSSVYSESFPSWIWTVVSFSDSNAVHKFCTWASDKGFFFSKLLVRTSKQYRQCAAVAIWGFQAVYIVATCLSVFSSVVLNSCLHADNNIGMWKLRGVAISLCII